jgi:hypothetical protein
MGYYLRSDTGHCKPYSRPQIRDWIHREYLVRRRHLRTGLSLLSYEQYSPTYARPNSLSLNPTRPDWLRTYRLLCAEMAEHARVILSIAMGRPSQAIMAHMLQPLYIAGRCLWQENEQRAVVSLLQQIEKDLGLATNYRIKALLKEWGTSGSTGYSELDAELSDLSN